MRRRHFLQFGLFGGGLLALGGTGLALWPPLRAHVPRRPLRAVDDARFPVLAAIAARVVRAPEADPVAIAHAVDETIARLPAEGIVDFNRLLGLVESGLSGLLLDGRPRPFTRLSPAAQDAALLAVRDSRFALRRSGYHAVRKLCLGAHYAREPAWPSIGYPGPPAIAPGTSVNPEDSAAADRLPDERAT